MESDIELTSVYIANGMALLLAVQLLCRNHWDHMRYIKNGIESKYLQALIGISAFACIIDPIICTVDGHSGEGGWLLVYALNLLLFIIDILVGIIWIVLICTHLLGRVPKRQKGFIAALSLLGGMTILTNPFIPILFSVDENSVYHRGELFWIITFIEGVFMLDGIAIYGYCKLRGGIFKFFPVWQFVVPIVVGITVQCCKYGVSTAYPSVMVSLAGLMSSLKDEVLFMDPLTGIYNRSFLDSIRKELDKKGSSLEVTGIMLDLNGFKAINDTYGHAEGDVALQKAANILKTSVGALGCVIRAGGDEFIVLLNTCQREIVDECIQYIRESFGEENRTSEKEYDLTMAIGCCSSSPVYRTLDDIVKQADRAMYKDKRLYHRK